MTSPGALLAYCVLESAKFPVNIPGVDDQPVRTIGAHNLVALYSAFPNSRKLNQEDALRFHAVLKSVFDKLAIIPFRFPTFLDDEAALRNHLEAKNSQYAADLARLRDFVQMELRVSTSNQETPRASGKQYLEAKVEQARALQEAVGAIRESAGDLISHHKERATEQGIRLFVLTKRSDIAVFREQVQSIRSPAALRILVSGPWPATEFLHE
jgi:gas vesicle protein GvpL/GvpF